MKDIPGTACCKENLTEYCIMVRVFSWAAQKFFSEQESKFPEIWIFMEKL